MLIYRWGSKIWVGNIKISCFSTMAPTKKRRLLLISNSRQPGLKYFEHCVDAVKSLLERNGARKILFVPYAQHDLDEYAGKVKHALADYELDVSSIHEGTDPVQEVEKAEAIYVGGGNTFLLLKSLYEKRLIEAIRKRILEDGVPYIGSSAGTNVSTCSINTTNDMPIVYPPSFAALNLVPFNINPHYCDHDPKSKHMGETRDERIKEYHEIEGTPPVLGLREGSWLECNDDKLVLHGMPGGKLFVRGKQARQTVDGEDLSFLLIS